jgi:hypothetical protein
MPAQPSRIRRGRMLSWSGSVAGKGLKLVAWEDSKVLALWLMSPSGDNYVGAEGFSNTGPPPPTGFWTGSTGPGNVVFDFGPAPMTAVRARLTAPRHPALFGLLPAGLTHVAQPLGMARRCRTEVPRGTSRQKLTGAGAPNPRSGRMT